jgi:hypothetical protein
MVGERPQYRAEVSPYIAVLWDGWPHTASMVRECWRSAYGARTTRGERATRRQRPLYIPDMLIVEHELHPSIHARLAVAASRVVSALAASTVDTDPSYAACQRDVRDALAAIAELRLLRMRSPATTTRIVMAP